VADIHADLVPLLGTLFQKARDVRGAWSRERSAAPSGVGTERL